jgi:DNA repair protein RecO (recombination protein O)
MQSRQIITRSIILNVTDYSDTSLILEVFSEDLGCISIIAKGAKREKRHDSGFYNTMSVLEMTLIKQQSDMYILSTSNFLENPAVTERWETFSLQSAGLELFRVIMVTHEEASEYYELLYSYLTFLAGITKNGILIFWRFLLRVYQKMGIGMDVSTCTNCHIEGKPITHYDSLLSGFICSDCNLDLQQPTIPIDPHVAQIIQALPHIGHKLNEIELTMREKNEIQTILLLHFEDHMHQKLYFKSLKELLK